MRPNDQLGSHPALSMPFFRENPGLLRAFREGQRDALERLYWATVPRVEHIVRYGFWIATSHGLGAWLVLRPAGSPNAAAAPVAAGISASFSW